MAAGAVWCASRTVPGTCGGCAAPPIPTVHTGDEVSVGQDLGRAGSIPNECAEETHIHLEVLQGEHVP